MNKQNIHLVTASELADLGLEAHEAAELAGQINAEDGTATAEARWERISHQVLSAQFSFPIHRFIYDRVFANWDDSSRPRPIWTPTENAIEQSNIAGLQNKLGLSSYDDLYHWSITERDRFWEEAIRTLGVRFKNPPSGVRDSASDPTSPRWLPDARLNIAESCFQADDNHPAIVQGNTSGELTHVSYGQLRELAGRVSRGLAELGLGRGDAVAIVMPMTVEAVAIYLGVVLCGGVVVSIADSFSPPEIATRLRIADTCLVFTVNCICKAEKRIPLYPRIVEADGPRTVVMDVLATDTGVIDKREANDLNLRSDDMTWDAFLPKHATSEIAHVLPDTPTNILFSSGTTGEPKAIPWDHTTPIKAATDGHFHQDIHPGDVVAWPTNLGWMMGPWLIFATLINRGTIALYCGGALDRPFGQFVQDARVNMLGLVPSMVRNWRDTACMEGLDWSAIKLLSSTGECSNPQEMFYLSYLAAYRPIIEYCGGTELGGGYITSTLVQPNAASTFTTPTLGSECVILDEQGCRASSGELFLVPPTIGFSSRLWGRDHHAVYYKDTPPGPEGQVLRRHGDQIEQLSNGYYRALGRADDTMNLGGIKVSSSEIERCLEIVEGIQELAAIATSAPDGGPTRLVICAVVLPSAESQDSEALRATMQQEIRSRLNPLFKIHEVVLLDHLPRTASQKVMRRELRSHYQKQAR